MLLLKFKDDKLAGHWEYSGLAFTSAGTVADLELKNFDTEF